MPHSIRECKSLSSILAGDLRATGLCSTELVIVIDIGLLYDALLLRHALYDTQLGCLPIVRLLILTVLQAMKMTHPSP